MPTGLISGLPVEYYMPWTFLFATALLASAVDAFARRPFNPIVLCVWFFGLTFCGYVGGWGVTELSAAAIILLTPHLLVCTLSGRAHTGCTHGDQDEQTTTHHAQVDPPIPLSDPQSDEPDQGYRRVA